MVARDYKEDNIARWGDDSGDSGVSNVGNKE